MAALISRAWIVGVQLLAPTTRIPDSTESLDIDRLQDSLGILGARRYVEQALDDLGWPTDLHFHRMIDRLLEREDLSNQEFESVGQIMQRCRLPHLQLLQGGRR